LCTKFHTLYTSHNSKLKYIPIKTTPLFPFFVLQTRSSVCKYSSTRSNIPNLDLRSDNPPSRKVEGGRFDLNNTSLLSSLALHLVLVHLVLVHLDLVHLVLVHLDLVHLVHPVKVGDFDLNNASLLSSLALRIWSSVNVFFLPVQAPVEEQNWENDHNVNPGHPDTHPALLL